jgi:hypothetical protein
LPTGAGSGTQAGVLLIQLCTGGADLAIAGVAGVLTLGGTTHKGTHTRGVSCHSYIITSTQARIGRRCASAGSAITYASTTARGAGFDIISAVAAVIGRILFLLADGTITLIVGSHIGIDTIGSCTATDSIARLRCGTCSVSYKIATRSSERSASLCACCARR